MVLNQTIIQNPTVEQFKLLAHKYVAVPELCIFAALVILATFIIGMFVYSDKAKFLKFFFCVLVIIITILVALIFIPSIFSGIVNWYQNLI